MDAKEIRLRCIEAITGMGIREVSRLTTDAEKLETWVNAAKPDKDKPPVGRPKKTADKE